VNEHGARADTVTVEGGLRMNEPAAYAAEDLCARLIRVPTAVVSDVLSTIGFPAQVLSSHLRAVGPARPFAGPALCLRGSEGPESLVPAKGSRPVFAMDRHITRGCVVVIATGGHKIGAVIGGNVGLSWHVRGCVGVVTDGGIRDAQEFNDMGLSVLAAFVGPMSNKGLWAFREIDVPVTLPGQSGQPVIVRPGDIVQADLDGAVVIPAAHTDSVVRDAEMLDQIEGRIRSDLEAGDDREDVYARHGRFGQRVPR
jgi:4-hydroxy-4-methyl-2-oxoglutarate aldolase